LAWAHEVEPDWLDVHHVQLALPRLQAAFVGLRLVQISDIHFDSSYMTRSRLDNIVRVVNQQRPDVVAITGDFVTFAPQSFASDLAAALGKLAPSLVTVAVLGNHDHWTNAAVVRRILHKSGIVELSNTVHTLQRKNSLLHLAGLDDAWARKAHIASVMQQLPEKGAAILLAHEPDFADKYAQTRRFDLQLSGHSHGGQVRLPFGGPLRLPAYGQKYHSGRYKVDEMIVYTNRGVGMVRPYVRFNCRPEITVFTLTSAA
jgi:predicted MPP superfamily phosphohydrolase